MRLAPLAGGLALLAGSCAPPPPAVSSQGAAPTPAPTPAPTTPPLPPFPEVARPRLDVALALDRRSVSFPAGDWLLRSGDRLERRRGAFVLSAAGPEPVVRVEEEGLASFWPSPLAVAEADGSPVPFGESAWRGCLLARATSRGTLHVIDRVNVEDYLKGVVPAEMGPRAYDEPEALKAQAVASRSWALRHRGDSAAEGYDLCSTPRCQAYGGTAVEQPLSTRAVEETGGEVLLWNEAVADTLFTSTCGGRTERAADVFPSYAGADVPYLVSVPCFGDEPVPLRGAAAVARRSETLLGVRGLALLAALKARPTSAGLVAARNRVRARLGLPPRRGAHPLGPAAAYAEIVEAAGFGDPSLLVEPVEVAAAPEAWPARSRAAWALLTRFQLGGGATLPTDRPLRIEEAAGIWAGLLSRLGDFDEVEARFIGSGPDGVVLKTRKGKLLFPPLPGLVLFAGGADDARPVPRLALLPGDRIRAFAEEGRLVGLLASPLPAGGTFDRDSAWVHWTRRFTGAELAAKLKERGLSRGSSVRRVQVLERGASGRASQVRVLTDAETVGLDGLQIRFALGLPEMLFVVVPGRDAAGEPVFTFYGRGWGHGVGLCQNGAFGMALAGKSYREILAHYYPGTVLGPLPPDDPGALR